VFSDLEGALRMHLQKGHSEPCLSKWRNWQRFAPAQRNFACWSPWLRIDIYDTLCKKMSLIMYEMCISSVYTEICASVVFKSWHKYITVRITPLFRQKTNGGDEEHCHPSHKLVNWRTQTLLSLIHFHWRRLNWALTGSNFQGSTQSSSCFGAVDLHMRSSTSWIPEQDLELDSNHPSGTIFLSTSSNS
jgi:hypothetical protein